MKKFSSVIATVTTITRMCSVCKNVCEEHNVCISDWRPHGCQQHSKSSNYSIQI